MASDPFSDILKLTRAESVVSGGFTAGGPWALRFAGADKIKYFAVVHGRCWLRLDGAAAPLALAAGDVFLIGAERSFVLASDLRLAALDARTVFAGHGGNIVDIGAGADTFLLGGHVRLDPAGGALLADVLPPLIHVPAAAPEAAVLQWLFTQLVHERADDLPGAGVAAAQLAQLMFVQLLRAHLAHAATGAPGWLRALGDARIAPALRLMHGEPARAWQLAELASAVAMSRTTFAVRFKQVAGVGPLTYLLHWRMRLAERALRDHAMPLATLARTLGYSSESAFSNAFKRTVGVAPKRYRDAARTAPHGVDQPPARVPPPAPRAQSDTSARIS